MPLHNVSWVGLLINRIDLGSSLIIPDRDAIDIPFFGEDSISTHDFTVQWSYRTDYDYDYNKYKYDEYDDEEYNNNEYEDSGYDENEYGDDEYGGNEDGDIGYDDNEYGGNEYAKKDLNGFYHDECYEEYSIMLVPMDLDSCQSLSDQGYLDSFFSTTVSGKDRYLDVPASDMTVFEPGETSTVDFLFYSMEYTEVEMCFSTHLIVSAPAATSATTTASLTASGTTNDFPTRTWTPEDREREEAAYRVPSTRTKSVRGWVGGGALVFFAGAVFWGLSYKRTIRLG